MPIPTLADYQHHSRSDLARSQSHWNSNGRSPLFSVITVVKDNADQLAATIESLISQTCQDFEYIVVDGGSTDQTLAVIDRYQAHIDCWISEPDLGIYDAMNKGVALAQGQVVATLNAGDLFMPHSLASVAQAYKQAATADVMIAGGLKAITKNGFYLAKSADHGFGNLHISVHQPALFVTKSIYQQMGLFETTYRIAGDYDFVLRTYRQVEVIILAETLTQTAPQGVSGDYYAATLESHRARLANGYPLLLAYLVLATKLFRVLLHLLLDKIKAWQVIEKIRHQITIHLLQRLR